METITSRFVMSPFLMDSIRLVSIVVFINGPGVFGFLIKESQVNCKGYKSQDGQASYQKDGENDGCVHICSIVIGSKS
jgi:hypothetical protein